jgi:predicted PurR-regulated permease PerM
MTRDLTLRASAAIIAAIAVSVAAYQAEAIFAPLTLGLFIIALVWPIQDWLQRRMPTLAALAIVMTATVVVVVAFASLIAWGFARVSTGLIADAARYQELYKMAVDWLDRHCVSIAGVWAENVNVNRMLEWARLVTSRVNTTLSFWLITFLYVLLGLTEVDNLRRKLHAFVEPDAAEAFLRASAETACKFRAYMVVRTQMSLATGALVGLFAWAVGLKFPAEWAVIAFTLNYIPFIGPFVATLVPTFLEMTQFTTWEALFGLFVGLNVIQFVIGSYVEPRVSGAVLAISPVVVLFAVFFWASVWGLYGAFIGVPIVIAALTISGCYPSTRWIADLFGGPLPPKQR